MKMHQEGPILSALFLKGVNLLFPMVYSLSIWTITRSDIATFEHGGQAKFAWPATYLGTNTYHGRFRKIHILGNYNIYTLVCFSIVYVAFWAHSYICRYLLWDSIFK